jgi:hypothetical protein
MKVNADSAMKPDSFRPIPGSAFGLSPDCIKSAALDNTPWGALLRKEELLASQEIVRA